MVPLKPGDIVVYEGKESATYKGYVGVAIKPWSRNGFPSEKAWVVEWFYLPTYTDVDKLWFFERNLRKLGEVQP